MSPAPYTTSPLVESRDRRVVDLSSVGFPEIPVLGMSRTSCATEGSIFHRHRQCMEITLCVRGTVKFDCGGKAFTLMPGSVFASQPEDVHRLRTNPRGARLCWLFFRLPKRGESALGLSGDETAFLVQRLKGLPNKSFAVPDDVRRAFLDLFAAYDLRGESAAGRTLLLRVALLRLLTALVASGGDAGERSHERVFGALIDRIRRHPEKDYGVDRLVAETSLSPNTILSRFRKLTGLPPQAFVMKCRIRRAMDMLSKGVTSITGLAAELGFSSSQHFATRFRQETGLTPKAWRARHQASRPLLVGLVAMSAFCAFARVDVAWGDRFDLPGTGVARPFAGVSRGVVLLAGGANFPDRPLVAGGRKAYHDEILMLDPAAAQPMWRVVGHLPRPQGEGGSATTAQGVVCVGGAVGRDGAEVASSAFVLSWDGTAVVQKPLPDVPVPLGKMPGVAALGDVVYVTGSNVLWRIDLASDAPRWEEAREVAGLPAVFGEQPVLVAQKGRLFLFPGYDARAGRALSARFGKTFVGASAVAVGDQHILFFGGADEAVWNAKPPPDRPVGDYRFAETIRAYSVVGDAWFELPGGVPRCGAAVVRLDDGRLLVAGGEVKPGVRTPESRLGTFRRPHGYSWVNVAVIAVYLAGMALMGVCFMRRNRSADDYFRAGGKLPWWVVSLSIYATMFSSITFISIPAMSYLDDCRYYVISFGILILAPVVAKWYLPFFRRLDLTSAYEYLEVRFNPLCRSFASAAFVLFMVARTAIVTYLPAIAISAVTDIDINVAIVAVTVVTVFYCTIGGVEAVVWSDFVQSVILIGSTALILAFLVFGTDGGLSGFLKMGASAGKFRVFDFAFDWTKPCFWVVLVGGLVANLASYTSDQCVVQRYMTTPDEKGAAKSIIFNGVLSFVNCFVFFVLGVALWTFYKSHPALLDVTMPKNDAILPLFIGNDLPVGVSGLVLAAVAAATMSTLSANLNAAASAITVDFYQRYWMRGSRGSHKLLVCGKVSTVVVGAFGGAMALGLANADIGNVYDQFQRFLGVLTGGLGCLFFMGIFMKRVNGFGATCGLVANYAVCLFLDQVSFAGKPHLLLYGFLGLVACLIVAPLASRVRRRG